MECGCEFNVLDENISNIDGLPAIDLDVYNLNKNCKPTWDLFHSGHIKGVFQFETYLGQHWSKQIQPDEIEDIAAIISAIRPGVLKSMLDNKSLTRHFADRKSGEEPVAYPHESLSEILGSTRGIILYQEQTLLIARKLAGFDLKDADILRRAMGKKDAALMTEVEAKFINGCNKVGIVDEEKAKEIFSWIRKSERYSFNKSHAIEYAEVGYITAYIKHHFPLWFYTHWLEYAKEKIVPQEEISQLVTDAKLFEVPINRPDITLVHNGDDFILHNKNVYFGLHNIKRVGDAAVKKLVTVINEVEQKLNKKIQDFSWEQFLYLVTPNVTKTAVNNIIMAGALQLFNIPRRKMLHEYTVFYELSEKEQNFVINNTSDLPLEASLQNLVQNCTLKPVRKDIILSLIMTLRHPPSELIDRPGWINKIEEDLLGVPLTCSSLDGLSTLESDSSCLDIVNGKESESILSVEIKDVKETTVKKGKSAGEKMAFLKVGDNSGDLDNVVCFCREWLDYCNLLHKYNTVLLYGQRTKQGSFMIKLAKQI